MRLQIEHGDIETAEETAALQAISAALSARRHPLTTIGTNDTTTFVILDAELPGDVADLVEATRAVYPWWKVRTS